MVGKLWHEHLAHVFGLPYPSAGPQSATPNAAYACSGSLMVKAVAEPTSISVDIRVRPLILSFLFASFVFSYCSFDGSKRMIPKT